jgi:hypothetical protein
MGMLNWAVLRNLPPALVLAFAALRAPTAVGAPVSFQNATATFTQAQFFVAQSVDGNLGGQSVVNGWATDGNGPHTAVYETQANGGGTAGAAFTFTLTQNFGANLTLGKFRFSVTTDARTTFADGFDSGGDVTATWTELTPLTALATNGATLTIQPDNSILASGTSPATSVYTVTATTPVTNITGLRLEVLKDASLPSAGPGRAANGNFVLQELQADAVTIVPEPATFGELAAVGGVLVLRQRGRGRGR